jgi:hypothetical protein
MPKEGFGGLLTPKTSILFAILIVLGGAPVFAFIDSPFLANYYPYGQDVANLIMLITYSWFLLKSNRKLYWLMLLMTISSLFAEIIGSILLGLYQYRLHNIPLYIPLGHAVIYATIYLVCKQPFIWRSHVDMERCLAKFSFVVSFMSLFVINDVGGFLGYLLFLIILRSRKKPLFYLNMFAMVYYIELCGTVCSTWSWYSVLGNHPSFPPIGYTPSGMAGLYILIDLVSNSIYFYALKFIRGFRGAQRTLLVETP